MQHMWELSLFLNTVRTEFARAPRRRLAGSASHWPPRRQQQQQRQGVYGAVGSQKYTKWLLRAFWEQLVLLMKTYSIEISFLVKSQRKRRLETCSENRRWAVSGRRETSSLLSRTRALGYRAEGGSKVSEEVFALVTVTQVKAALLCIRKI